MIDRYLSGKQMKRLNTVALPTVFVPPVLEDEEGEAAPRIRTCHIPVSARVKNFDEVDLAPTEAQALCEARRCLRCDIRGAEKQLDGITKKYVDGIDELLKAKEAELLEV